MEFPPTVIKNAYGGYYEHGRAFSKAKWVSIIATYEREIERMGSCSDRRLAELSFISKKSAEKAKLYHGIGIIPPSPPKGHGYSGTGSLSDFEMKHHAYIFELYLRNPSLPLNGYS